MEGSVRPVLEQIGARRVEMFVEFPERVVDGGCPEHAYPFASVLAILEILGLNDDTETVCGQGLELCTLHRHWV